jgi:acetyl-CoA carboxylase carboxyltransferase component
MDHYIQKLRDMKQTSLNSPKEVDTQHQKNRLMARERLDHLLDPGSFNEIDALVLPRYEVYPGGKKSRAGDGIVTGFGQIHGRNVMVASQDISVVGGTFGEMHANKIVKMIRMAIDYGVPFIGLYDSGGARIQEGVDSLGGISRIFDANCEASGVIPQISVIMGTCAGGAVYSPALTDFVFMTENSYMFITGPDVVRAVMQENVSLEELGGGSVHNIQSGVSHFLAENDQDCLALVRELMTYLPSNNRDDPPYVRPLDDPERSCHELAEIVPVNPYKPYDVKKVIMSIVDEGRFFEVHALWAQNIVVGFARLNGWVVGIIANQPMVLAGTIDIHAAVKTSHFIRMCDAYNIPVITLQDVPGFLPGKNQEYGGIIRNGARMIYAYSEATVPKLMVVLRKSYGGAYCVMSSKGLRGDLLYAWPNAEFAVMGPEGAVSILYRNELKNSADPTQKRKELENDYREKFNNPYVAAARGLIDAVIEPNDTRMALIRGLELCLSKREKHTPKKHGISPM